MIRINYIIIALLISSFSYAEKNRKPSSKALSQECPITHKANGSIHLIDGGLAQIQQPLQPLIKRPLGCEKIRLPGIGFTHLYKIQIIAHPKENSQNSLCSLEERLYWRDGNTYKYQLSKLLEVDIDCDEPQKYNPQKSIIKTKLINSKNYIYIDSGEDSDYFTYYEVLKNSKENRKTKYKGAMKREFFN